MWSHRLAVRTLASHAGNRGSIPRGITIKINRLHKLMCGLFCFYPPQNQTKVHTMFTPFEIPKTKKGYQNGYQFTLHQM